MENNSRQRSTDNGAKWRILSIILIAALALTAVLGVCWLQQGKPVWQPVEELAAAGTGSESAQAQQKLASWRLTQSKPMGQSAEELAAASAGSKAAQAQQNTEDAPLQLTARPAAGGDITNAEPVVAIAEKCSPSVVGVTTYIQQSTGGYFNPFGFPFGGQSSGGTGDSGDTEYVEYAYGSGVIIQLDGDYYIITNHHVIDSAAKIGVTFYDDTKVDATLVGSDMYSDIAVLKLDADVQGMTAADIGDSDTLQVGSMCVAIGNPLGFELFGTVTLGIVSSTSREVELRDGRIITAIQTDAAINSGNSGGGMFNAYGELIGITSLKMGSSSTSSASVEGLGFAIPVNTAMSMATQIISSGAVTYPTLGITGENYTADDGTSGVRVVTVTQDTPAWRGGLQVGDIITAYDGQSVSSFNELKSRIYKSSIGDTVTLTVLRDGTSMTLDIVYTYDISI